MVDRLNKFQWGVATGLLLVMTICISVLMPLLLGQDIKEFIKRKVQLDLTTQNYWSHSPGQLSRETLRQYTTYNNSDPLSDQDVSLDSAGFLTYNVSTKMDNASFVPNTGQAIQFLARESIELQGSDKADKVQHINMNILMGFEEEQSSGIGRTTLISFSQVQAFLQNTWVPFHLAYVLKHNDLDIQSKCNYFFNQAGITLPKTLSALYSHPIYGWQTAAGLRHWVQLSFLDQEGALSAKDYQAIQAAIGLTEHEMLMLVSQKNTNYSSLYDALFNNVIIFCGGEWDVKIEVNKPMYRQEMADNQWAQSLISKVSCAFYAYPPYDSSKDLVSPQELIMDSPVEYAQLIGNDMNLDYSKALLASTGTSSLLDLDNMSYFVDTNNSMAMVRSKLQLSIDDATIDLLRKYLQETRELLVMGKDSQGWMMNQQQRAVLFLAEKAVNRQFTKLVDDYQTAVLSSSLQKVLNTDSDCESIMNSDPSLQPLLVTVCANSHLSFSSSILIMNSWVDLLLNMENSTFFKVLEQAGVTREQIITIFKQPKFETIVKKDLDTMNVWQNETCDSPQNLTSNPNLSICDSVSTALFFWGDTMNRDMNFHNAFPSQFLCPANGVEYQTVAPNFAFFSSFIELTTMRDQYLNSGSILTYHQILNLVKPALQDKTDPKASQTYTSIRQIVISAVFGGKTQMTTSSQLLTGMPYYYVRFLKEYPITQGGYKQKSQVISLQSLDNSGLLASLGADAFSQVNTGLSDIAKVKQLRLANNRPYVSYIKQVDNGKSLKLEVIACHSPRREINGTDGDNFPPQLSSSSSLSQYSPSLYQTLQLKNKGLSSENTDSLKSYLFDYSIEPVYTKQFISMPMVITDIHHQGLVNSSVLIQGQKYQKAHMAHAGRSQVQVELFSGIVISSREGKQFNIVVELNELTRAILKKPCIYPIFTVWQNRSIDKSVLEQYLHFAYDTRGVFLIVLATFISLSVVLVLIMVCLMRSYYKNKQQQDEVANPLMQAHINNV